jgi:hypothetical protein
LLGLLASPIRTPAAHLNLNRDEEKATYGR